jgi:hypothetical protein
MRRRVVALLSLVVATSAIANAAQQPPAGGAPGRGRGQEPGPTITVQGHTFTQQSLFQRNIGGPDDMTTPFPPHKIIGKQKAAGSPGR